MSLVIITGASKGIGMAAAARFIANGNKVLNISRTPSQLDGITNVALDLAASDANVRVAHLVDGLEAGEIHLIHNAAKLVNDSVRDVDAAIFRSIISINIMPCYRK